VAASAPLRPSRGPPPQNPLRQGRGARTPPIHCSAAPAPWIGTRRFGGFFTRSPPNS
jgi:hypothetical protein